jgi:hypothetical protein
MATSASEAYKWLDRGRLLHPALVFLLWNHVWILDRIMTFNDIPVLVLFSLWYLLFQERKGIGFTEADPCSLDVKPCVGPDQKVTYTRRCLRFLLTSVPPL